MGGHKGGQTLTTPFKKYHEDIDLKKLQIIENSGKDLNHFYPMKIKVYKKYVQKRETKLHHTAQK